MANNFRISNVCAKAMADTFDDQVQIGSTASVIDIRTGAQPADPDTAATGTLLGTLTMTDPNPFGSATDANPGGLLTAASSTQDSSADATGTGADDVADGECGTSGADLNFNTVSITSGSAISITSLTVTMRET